MFDLGLSSDQLEDEGRGFSFQEDRPLNMSFSSDDSTREIVNKYSEKDLATLIKEYGEEKFAKRIAEKIVQARKEELITTTGQLKAIIEIAVPPKYYKRIHPATKTFQALRIASNKELRNIEESLPRVAGLLKSGGRLAVVSYHSLEDRIVKNYFRRESKDCLCPPQNWVCDCGHSAQLKTVNKKIITPSASEVEHNPKARSAKLRVAEKI